MKSLALLCLLALVPSEDRTGVQFTAADTWQIGDTGEFTKPKSTTHKKEPPFEKADAGYSYWIIRIDGDEEMVVRVRVVTPNGNKMDVGYSKYRVIKGIPTKGLKAGEYVELKGTFKITDTRRSKAGTGYFVWEKQE